MHAYLDIITTYEYATIVPTADFENFKTLNNELWCACSSEGDYVTSEGCSVPSGLCMCAWNAYVDL